MKKNLIMVADGDEPKRIVTSNILKDAGYEVVTAQNSDQVFAMMESHHPDLLLLDVMLHNESGFDILKKLKSDKKHESISIVMLSGIQTESEHHVTAMELGADGFINRETPKRELVAWVEALSRHKRAKDELIALNVTKNKFLSIIAHDLKGPFHGLLNLSDMMANESENFTIQEFIQTSKNLHESAENIYQLLHNLLEWARMQKASIEYSPTEFNLFSIVAQSIALINHSAQQKSITIHNEIDKSLNIVADERMMQTILRNLISNAVKFTGKKGKVKISCLETSNCMVKISVTDNGVGLSADDIEKLFRIDGFVKSKGTEGEPGTGLGLILCKEFVEKHGGKIWVQSEVGKGSKFHFTIRECVDD